MSANRTEGYLMSTSELNLTERQTKILDLIIENYMRTGDPVGSRTLSKASDLNLSSATIRNEMSDLEEMGLILQPHTSAGRIPSDLGYRYYVNKLIDKKDAEITEVKELMFEKTEKLEKTLKQVVKVLAHNTQYATMISAPSVVGGKVRFIQLSAVDEENLLAVVVMDSNSVNNKMIRVENMPNNENMLKLNMLLNTTLNGIAVSEINLALMTALKQQCGEYENIVQCVLDSIAESVRDNKELEIYTSGATNIFKYPELADTQKASKILNTFEEKDELVEFLNNTDDENTPGTGIQVYIGEESSVSTMKDCSVVTATLDLGGGVKGTVGIVGPKRMDYKNAMDNLNQLKIQLDKMLEQERN